MQNALSRYFALSMQDNIMLSNFNEAFTYNNTYQVFIRAGTE